jgi:hypothetical protein
VAFASDNPAVATVAGNTVTLVAAGTANITATQAGNGNYSAAIPVVRSLEVTDDSSGPGGGGQAGKGERDQGDGKGLEAGALHGENGERGMRSGRKGGRREGRVPALSGRVTGLLRFAIFFCKQN